MPIITKTNTIFKDIVTTLRESHVLLQESSEAKLAEDSLDAQVDKYLISYEADSKIVKKESYDFRQSMLFEAEEDEEEKSDEDKVKKLSVEDLDMEAFVNNVMRLVENYDSLLEVRDTILKRALNFISKNYKKDAQDTFESTMLDLYGVEIGSSKQDIGDEYFPAPRAGAAGPSGGAG
jgi:hypothetical protein